VRQISRPRVQMPWTPPRTQAILPSSLQQQARVQKQRRVSSSLRLARHTSQSIIMLQRQSALAVGALLLLVCVVLPAQAFVVPSGGRLGRGSSTPSSRRCPKTRAGVKMMLLPPEAPQSFLSSSAGLMVRRVVHASCVWADGWEAKGCICYASFWRA
jgi:hypothetical protein